MKRLTDEQRARAEAGYHLALKCAHAALRPGLDYGVLLSQASLGLVYAASRWDPAKSPDGENGWEPHAVQTIRWSLLYLWGPRSKQRFWLEPCGQQVADFTLEAAPARPAALRAEAADEVAAGMRALSDREQRLLWAVRAMGETYEAAGRAEGISHCRVWQILKKAERKFRKARLCHYAEAS